MALNTRPQFEEAYLVIGDGADLVATSSSDAWPATTRLVIESAAGVETSFVPTISGLTALWSLTIAEVTALIGAKEDGQLRFRITTNTADQLRGKIAGELSILTKWRGVRGTQSLGAVVVGPAGPGIASGAIDADGELVLTLDNAAVLAAIQLPPVVGLAIDADGDYYPAAGTDYVLTPDADGDYTVREIA